MMEILAPVLFMLLIGGVSGYFAGQLFKRAAGMALSIGIIIAVLIILIYSGTFNINVDSINAAISNLINLLTTLGLVTIISSVPFVASFIAGIFIGYRRY